MSEVSLDDRLLQDAVAVADDTRLVQVEPSLRHQAADVFAGLFGQKPAIIIADTNTFRAAGEDVLRAFRRKGHACREPLVLEADGLCAEYKYVEAIQQTLAERDAVAVAVGSGTINDLTKLASHHLRQPYLTVATAASMDGYTAFGASITRDGLKQTFSCPAPTAVLADLEVIQNAPEGLNASGYADLLAKVVAGADWLVADALGVEPMDPDAWHMMQSRLLAWLADPDGIRTGQASATRCLTLGLLMSGLAMQRTKTSRVASGAEHHFSHLWDMQHHRHDGRIPSHGFKVGIGTLASAALYEYLLAEPLESLDVETAVGQWPDADALEAEVQAQFDLPALVAKGLEEMRAKYTGHKQLRQQLERLKQVWPALAERLRSQLLSFDELTGRLEQAGCPWQPEQIGISRARLRKSYRQAYYTRRRFTVLDLAIRSGLFQPAMQQIFGPNGRWPTTA